MSGKDIFTNHPNWHRATLEVYPGKKDGNKVLKLETEQVSACLTGPVLLMKAFTIAPIL